MTILNLDDHSDIYVYFLRTDDISEKTINDYLQLNSLKIKIAAIEKILKGINYNEI